MTHSTCPTAAKPTSATPEYSLTTTIYRYRAEMFTQIANQMEAEERGDTTEYPVTYWPLIEKIEKWDRPVRGPS